MKNIFLSNLLENLKEVENQNYESLLLYIERAKRIFISGLGRSGLVGKFFAMRLMHLGLESYVVGETTCPSIKKNDLLIIISSSGKNQTLLNFVKIASTQGAKIFSITSKDTPLKKVSDFSIEIPKGESNQFKNSLFEQTSFLFLELFIEIYRQKKGVSYTDMSSRHANLE